MKRALLLAVLVAALLPFAAQAAPPEVDGSAYIVQDARTGEVLAASRSHARLPIASITKLMTVLVTLEHHKLTDVVEVDPRAAAVGPGRERLRRGHRGEGPGRARPLRRLARLG